MFGFDYGIETRRINAIINRDAGKRMSDEQFIEKELQRFFASPVRRDMITGEKYYKGDHEILLRKRMVLGESGKMKAVENLPNNRVVDNQYAKLVDQKTNYLLSRPITFKSDDIKYTKLVAGLFDRRFMRLLKGLGEDGLNGGIAWLYVYLNNNGELEFRRFKPYEVLPFWADEAHTELDCAVRTYQIDGYKGETEVTITKVEVYTKAGIKRYELDGARLVPDPDNADSPYIVNGVGQAYTWNKIPLIAFKHNSKEIPLIKRVKSLQDALNTVRSDFINNMQEDARNTILVIKNYDGTDLGEFRQNLATYGAVKVKTIDGADGGIDTLTVTVNSENYKTLIDMLKRAIVENARGYDCKDDRMANNPNQMNIQSMYSDIDLDANGTEAEYQAAFEELLFFVDSYFANNGLGDYSNTDIDVIFDKDHLINESEAITNCKASVGIISDETIVSQHPWVADTDEELKRLEEKADSIYADSLGGGHIEPTE